jgi:hypothetical protein
LINAIKTEIPEFFKQLREGVYPAFVRATEGWISEHDGPPTLMFVSDGSELKAALLQWARNFNLNAEKEEEKWILDGALSLLWHWQRYAKNREALDVEGFLLHSSAAWGLVTEAERQFDFQHAGWNPQFQTWSDFNQEATAQFEAKLREYKQQIRNIVESRGGVQVQIRYSSDDFRYFALYRFRGMSAARIFKHLGLGGDSSTIHKGVSAAADMLQMSYKRNIK